MHSSFDTAEECDRLQSELNDRNKDEVGIRFAKSQKPEQNEFFPTIESATERLTELVKDHEVNGLWVGCKEEHQPELLTLLEGLNEFRSFSGMTSYSRGTVVYDLL